MKVFANNLIDDIAINRVATALKKYAPSSLTFVESEEDADLVIIYAHGLRRGVWWRASRLLKSHKKYAVVQLSLRITANPKTEDWLKIWENAQMVWSYFDLPKLCKADGNSANFNFYQAPLGVDSDVFKEVDLKRKYIAAVVSKGWSKESLGDVTTAARAVGRKVLNIGTQKELGEGIDYTGLIINDDATLSRYYSQCQYVSGLRRIEGFEMPVIEGLLCGARPICFDLDCYRMWFEGLSEFIPENGSGKIIPSLIELFKKKPRPVTDKEKKVVIHKFDWSKIARGFWKKIV